MVWQKTAGFTAGVAVFVGLMVFGFQNCAPEQYFRAPKSEQTDGSSVTPPVGGLVVPASARYHITVGELKPTAAGLAAGQQIFGRMMMVRDMQSGATETFTHAMGLPVSAVAAAHVHDLPCAAAAGGGHYKLDYANTATVQSNEIWPSLAAGADGIGSGYARVSHLARPEAQSVVIHDAAGARHACGLLHSTWASDVKGGLFSNLAGGVTATPNLRGSASISRIPIDGQTIVRVSVNGLAPNTTYGSHVHALPCNTPGTVGGTDFAGGHYKQNPDVTEVVATAAAEIWTSFTTNATGHGETRTLVNHAARPDAQSIIIHDPVTPTIRLACVDLNMAGGMVGTEVGITRFPNIFGSGKMERLASGDTKVTMAMSGLAPNTSYTAHVHDRPCHIAGGGGHYKIDYSVAAAIESNEIWVRITTDAAGAGTGVTTSKHLARPEAYSIVIHDADTARLACVDLY